MNDRGEDGWVVVGSWSVPSRAAWVRETAARATRAALAGGLAEDRAEALESAVAEAVANAVEHGNEGDERLLVALEVVRTPDAVRVRIRDAGRGGGIPAATEPPDVRAMVRGEQAARGWGLLLMRGLVDEVRVLPAPSQRAVELVLWLPGSHADRTRPVCACR
jgi:anti-sigma regulatory factor (Ser/Thr protein kinase)